MKLVLIGTDHNLQQSLRKDPVSNAWIPRDAKRFRRLIAYCIDKFGVKIILEEAHPMQDETAPTIGSSIAKERGLPWKALGYGEPDPSDVLIEPPIQEAIRTGVKPEVLAGRYKLELQGGRESFMYATIMQASQAHDCILAVVGYLHLGVLARMFEGRQMNVEALIFTYPLVVDESRA
jgi:hypothetical protein